MQEENYKIKITYTGTIIMDVTAINKKLAVDTVFDEIASWEEEEFIENLDLEVSGVGIKRLHDSQFEEAPFDKDEHKDEIQRLLEG
jgi:hypothetical protein